MRNWIKRTALVLICWGTVAAAAWGDPWRCCHCGGCQTPRQVCRLVPDVERVVEYQYFERCEQFCVPGKSCCVGCVPKQCIDPRLPMQYDKIWQPTCGPTFTRGKLCKRPVVCERPVMRCVVEQVCCGCGQADPKLESTSTWSRDPRLVGPAAVTSPTCAAQPALVDQSMFGGAPPWLDRLIHAGSSSSPPPVAGRPAMTR
jgi:hypothetical protein